MGNQKLKDIYRMITLGGDAELDLVDTMDPFEEGVTFTVRPPNKSWKEVSNLSGGEKTLSSLAVVFSLHYYRPTPFYVMDEIDAALDFKNVSIIGNYVKYRTKNAQFIIISLRSQMYELANQLIGIYKNFNCTKSVCVLPSTIVEMYEAAGQTMPMLEVPPLTKEKELVDPEQTSQPLVTSTPSAKKPEVNNVIASPCLSNIDESDADVTLT